MSMVFSITFSVRPEVEALLRVLVCFWKGNLLIVLTAWLLTYRGCGRNLGLVYAVNPRLARYSMGLRELREILMPFSLYQRL